MRTCRLRRFVMFVVVVATAMTSVGLSSPPAQAAPQAAPQQAAPQQATPRTNEAATNGQYHPLTPARILDTRENLGAAGKRGPGSTTDLRVTGLGGVPATGVSAVVLNMTITEPTAPSYLTVFPTGSPRPDTSNLNYVGGLTIANLVIVKVGDGGLVSLYNYDGETHVVADVQGWFSTDSAFQPQAPQRILDTRLGLGVPAALGPDGSAILQVAGRGGIEANAKGAVVLNVTVTEPTEPTFVTVWPTGAKRPFASNLNALPGQSIPNLVIAPLAADGTVSLYNSAGSTHLVADVQGFLPTQTGYRGLTPERIMDTRKGLGVAKAVGPNNAARLQVAGRGGVPDTGAAAVVLNVTVTNPTAPTYVTVWPSDRERPLASNLNALPGVTIPNLVIAPIAPDGTVSLYNYDGTSDLVADVQGWVPDGTDAGRVASWSIEPSSVLLGPGESRELTMRAWAADGTRIDSVVPAGATLSSTGSGSTMTDLGGGRYRVTAGNQTSTTMWSIAVPGSAPTIVSASVVGLASGVSQIADERVVFPVPYLTDPAAQQDGVLGELMTTEAVAGFTNAEIAARTLVNDGTGPAALGVGVRLPLILRGAPPAVGSLVITAGGTGVTGRVVERPGAPSLERGGYSLITVESVALETLYADLKISFGKAEIAALGMTTSQSPRTQERTDRTQDTPADPLSCDSNLGILEVKATPLKWIEDIEPDIDIDIVAHNYRFIFRDRGDVSSYGEATVQLGAQASCTYKFPRVTAAELPLPAFLSFAGSIVADLQLYMKISAALKLGVSAKAVYSCKVTWDYYLGFNIVSGVSQPLPKSSHDSGCKDSSVSLGGGIADHLAAQLSIDADIGVQETPARGSSGC